VDANDNDIAGWWVSGGDLVMTVNGTLAQGDQFEINLTNAIWMFRNSTALTDAEITSTASLFAPQRHQYAFSGNLGASALITSERTLATQGFEPANRPNNVFYTNTATPMTYDHERGAFFVSGQNNERFGSYLRYPRIIGANHFEVPYALTMSNMDNNRATVTILGAVNQDTGVHQERFSSNLAPEGFRNAAPTSANVTYEIRIPLVSFATDNAAGDNDKTVSIIPLAGASITPATFNYASGAVGPINLNHSADFVISRDDFRYSHLRINEQRLGVFNPLNTGGTLTLALPEGYHFYLSHAVDNGWRNAGNSNSTDKPIVGANTNNP
jgi:hypothetical protein